jgi:hypothetical protein
MQEREFCEFSACRRSRAFYGRANRSIPGYPIIRFSILHNQNTPDNQVFQTNKVLGIHMAPVP